MNHKVNIPPRRSSKSHMTHDGGTLHFRTPSKSYVVDHCDEAPISAFLKPREMDSEKAVTPRPAVKTPTPTRDRILEDHPENIVDFNGPEDPANPLNWSTVYKWSIVVLVSIMSLVVNLAILMCAPATPSILLEFNSSSPLESTVLVSIWELGEVFGPLIVAPLSELYGRLPVYHTANILFVLSSAAAAKSPSINVLIGCRFLLGLTVASTTLNSCIVADMFKEENRGRALAIMGMTPAIAPVLGPAVGGYISEYLGWRWTFWVITIATGAFELCFLATFCESYKVVILKRKARRLRFETGNGLLRSRYDNGLSGFTLLGELILRPFTLLFFSPVIILVSICGAFAISYTYVVITSISGIYGSEYGFSQGPLGLTYLGLGFGMILSAILCGAYLNRRQGKFLALTPPKPEHRLHPMVLGHLLVPLGLIAYGWTAEYHTHWIFPILSSAPVGFGFVAVSIASWGYLVDAFGIYAASATAAVTALRNISAVALPLAGPVLFAKMGVGWGCTILGAVAVVGTIVPVLLMRCGERMRGRGKFQVRV